MPARRSPTSRCRCRRAARGIEPDDPGWPADGYRGDYISDVAQAYLAGESVHADGHEVARDGDVDDLDAIRHFAVAWLRHEQDEDLRAFGVAPFDVFFLESSLYSDGLVEKTVRELVAHGHTYEKDGALWLQDHGLRRRQGSRHAQVRRQLHVFPAGRRLPPDQVAARLPARDHRTRRRSSFDR